MRTIRLSLVAMGILSITLNAEISQIEPIVIGDSSGAYERDDIKLDSINNLYRVESSAKAGVQVITQKEIEAYHPKDVLDLLDKAIGIDVTFHGRKSPFFVNVRGGGSLTYIIDGAILPSPANRILQKIPTKAIEEIQIIRGSTALALAPSIGIGASNSGSGINTGFVVIRTKRAKNTEGFVSGYVEKAESNPTSNGQSLYIGTTLDSKDGELSGYIGALVSRYDRPSSDERFDGSDAKSGMINGGLSYRNFNLNMMAYKDSGTWEMQRGEDVNGVLDDSKWYYDPIKTDIFSLDANIQWSESQTTLVSFGKTKYRQAEYSNEKFGQNNIPISKKYYEDSSAYSLRHNVAFGDTLIMLGAQMSKSDGFGPETNSPYRRFDTSLKGYSASIEQKLFDGDVVLDGGYRYDQKHINNSSTNATKDSANNDVDLAPAKVFALGAMWNLNDRFSLSSRYFQGDEGSSSDFDLLPMPGNSPFKAEKQKRFEISASAKIVPYFNPEITYFSVDFKNQKSATNNTYTDIYGSEYYYYTQSDSLRKGLEFTFRGDFEQGSSYLFSYTRMLDIKTEQNGLSTNKIGLENPRDSFTALLSHKWNGYSANISAKHMSGWSQSTSAMGIASDVYLGDFIKIDANIAKDFKYSNLDFNAKLYGRNLGDSHYSTRYTTGYYKDRGRVVGVELSAKF